MVREDEDEEEDDTEATELQKTHHTQPPHQELSNNWEALNAKLTFESMQQKEQDQAKSHEVSIGEYTGDDYEGNDAHDGTKKRAAPVASSPEDAKKKNFADKRAAHYNEVRDGLCCCFCGTVLCIMHYSFPLALATMLP